jgi:hypothetical protein
MRIWDSRWGYWNSLEWVPCYSDIRFNKLSKWGWMNTNVFLPLIGEMRF